jgi:hypothetical protein
MLGVPPGSDSPPARVAAALPSVEAPFTYALQLLKEAVALNWQMGTPLPADYQLSLNVVWLYGRGVEEYRLAWEPAGEAPLRQLERERGLLDRPHFEGWALVTANVYQEAHELVANGITSPEHLSDESWRALLPAVMKLARSEFGIEKRALYGRRLRLMADWLHLAGRERDAELAASAAQTMRASPPETNQFALGLLQRGLAVALEHLTRDANGSGQATR